MAVVLGNIALVIDVSSPRIVVLERKNRPPAALDLLLRLSKRELHSITYGAAPLGGSKGFEADGGVESRANSHKAAASRGKANSKANAVDSDSGSSEEEGNGNGGDEEELKWEMEMRKRVKGIEEMRELVEKAEELQSRAEESSSASEEMEEEEMEEEEMEEEKRMRVRRELEKVAKEQAERRATATLMFELGQKAYGRGTYGRAVEFLEGALTIIPKSTLFGGEIQIWLAMAYEANNRHKDCIALYQLLEKKHPSISIRRQAAELRYILQAPKIKISQEEMVTIPLIGSSYDSYAATWSDKYKDSEQKRSGSVTNQLASSKDYLGDFLVWRPPTGMETNRAFWVAVTLWICLVGAALFLQ